MRLKSNLMESIINNLKEASLQDYLFDDRDKEAVENLVNEYSSLYDLVWSYGDDMDVIFSNGVIFKFALNDDDTFEYYVIDSNGRRISDIYLVDDGLVSEVKDISQSELTESEDQDKFNYMMLSRLKSDCDYYLGNGNRNPKHLWAGDEAKQIAKMREFYDKVPEEPEWLTKEDIDDYEDKMINGSEDSPENHIENPTVIEDKDKINESELSEIDKAVNQINSKINELNSGKEDSFEVEADFKDFPEILSKLNKEDRLKGLMMLYMSNPKPEELNSWDLDKLLSYIEETDEYFNEDKEYIDKCINLINGLDESSLEDSRNNVIKELSSIIEEAGLTYEEVFEDIYTRAGENSELIDIVLSNMLSDYKEYLGESSKYNREEIIKELSNVLREANISFKELFDDMFTRAGENSELIDIILSNMLEDYKEYLGEAAKIATKYNLKEDSYEDSLFTDIEAALNQYGFDVTRYTDAGIMTKNIGWIVSNSEGEVNLTCVGTYLDESSVNDNSDIKKLEKYIKGSTLNDAAKFLGMYFHGDGDSFEVQGSELVDKKHKDNKIACSMDGDKIVSIANDLSNLKEDSIVSENDQYRAMLVDLMEDDDVKQEVINCINKEDKTIGSVSYTIYKDSNEYHVYNIAVSPEYRRKGVGTFLLKSLQDIVGDNDIYFDTLTPSGKALLDKIASYDKYKEGKLGANLYKGKIN